MRYSLAFQRIVKEIKDLIKEQKREGGEGPLDLSSSNLMERKKRRSVRKPSAVPTADPLDFAESESTEALLSTIKQVSWTNDIDLTKGTPFTKQDQILEEDGDKVPLITGDNAPMQGIDNPAGPQLNQKTVSSDNKAAPPRRGRSGRSRLDAGAAAAEQVELPGIPHDSPAAGGARPRSGKSRPGLKSGETYRSQIDTSNL